MKNSCTELFWNGNSGLNQSKVDSGTLAMCGPTKQCVKSFRFMKSDLDHICYLLRKHCCRESELRLITVRIMNTVPTKFVYYKRVLYYFASGFLVKN